MNLHVAWLRREVSCGGGVPSIVWGEWGGWRGLHSSLDPCHTHPNNHKLLARGASAQRRCYGLDLPRSDGSTPRSQAPLAMKELTNGVPMGQQRGAHTIKSS